MKFSVAVEPLPQPRPRFGRGKVFEPAKITTYKAEIKSAAQKVMGELLPISMAVKVQLKFYRKFKAASRRFGDADNLAKAILDACNGILWQDDSQIVSLSTEKFQSAEPRVEVEVVPAELD